MTTVASSTTQQACKVLLIEDNPADVELIRIAIERAETPFSFHTVAKLNDGLAAVHDDEWNIIVSDLSLPDSQGLDTVRAIRRHAPNVPIIVLTSLSSDEIAIHAIDEGAQDYLVKDTITTEILERAVRYAIQRQKNSEMRRLIEILRNHEHLLNSKNRRLETLYKTAHRFVDNVSHEFRTPLTVIKEYVSLVRDGLVGDLNEEQRQMLDVVGDRADDLNNMVDDMLDISKLEAGMMGIWRKNCTVGEIIKHIRPNLEKKSSVKEVGIEFDLPDDLPEIYCDDEKIGRVIVNLTTNAIKFSGEPGHVRLWARSNHAQRELVIGVTDNGPGISEENINAIFERFKQVSDNPRGSTKGFGLGLNIAKELVDLNLGEMNVESTTGQGSTFSFTVPFAQPNEVVRRYIKKMQHLRNGSTVASLLIVRAQFENQISESKEVNGFLNLMTRRHDLLFQVSDHQWAFILPLKETELPKVLDRFEKALQEANHNRPNGQLPELQFEIGGSWNVADQSDAMLAQIHKSTQAEELLHA
jgi:signal transduction histidine kinase